MFRVARVVYNGRSGGRSFSFTSGGEFVAVRRVGVFV